MNTHRFEGIRYEFVPGGEIVPYLAPHESRRLFGGAEGPVHSHTHEQYVAVDDETGHTYGRPPVRTHSHPLSHPDPHSPSDPHPDPHPRTDADPHE
jgi:urease accessory protein